MATNRADTLDPALLRPGRLDRKIEFPLPDRRQKRLIFSTITSKMNLSEEVCVRRVCGRGLNIFFRLIWKILLLDLTEFQVLTLMRFVKKLECMQSEKIGILYCQKISKKGIKIILRKMRVNTSFINKFRFSAYLIFYV